MIYLKDVCSELVGHGEELKRFWDQLWQALGERVGQNRYSSEVARIEKFQSYDCRPTFRIAFMGEQSCGKSIFINELMQEEIVLSGAAEVTFVPTVIVFDKRPSFSFFYYTQKEIKDAVKPYYDYYTNRSVKLFLENYQRNQGGAPITLETLMKIQDFQSLRDLDTEILKLLFHALWDVTKDIKIAKDFVNFVYALKTPQLTAKLSNTDERNSASTDFNTIKERGFLLRRQDTKEEFPVYDRNKIPLYEIYLIHHIYQTVAAPERKDLVPVNTSSMEFVDLPGIDAITIRVRHASLFFLKEVDALILMTDTQRALTLPAQEILRTLKGSRQKTDLEDSLFIAINKYDTINAVGVPRSGEADMESFQNTLDSVQRNIQNVIGKTKVEIFITSALMSQFYRKEQNKSLEPANLAKLQAFFAMQQSPNLSGDPQIDAQIHSLFEEHNVGGIPQVRKRIEEYLQKTSLTIKKRYFLQAMQSFWKELEESFLPWHRQITKKWQDRDQVGYDKIREKLVTSLQLALAYVDSAIFSMSEYLVPLKEFGTALRADIQKLDCGASTIKNLANIDRYNHVQNKLEETLKADVLKFLGGKYQEALEKALTPVQPLLQLMRSAPEMENLKDPAEKILFFWKLHQEALYLRFLELVADKPRQDSPSYLQDCYDPNLFISKMKDVFLHKIEPAALGNCTRVWTYSLYCLTEIQKSLQTIRKWAERQNSFSDFWLKALLENSPEDKKGQEEYNKASALYKIWTENLHHWKDLQQKIQEASY